MSRIVVTGKTLDAVAEQVRKEHGPRARIVEAQRVTSGGIAGLFTRRYVEATVELPERGRRSARGGDDSGFQPTPAQRVGLAALLADAEEAEDSFLDDEEPPTPFVSTRSGAFAELMDDLAFNGVVDETEADPAPSSGFSRPAAAWPASDAPGASPGVVPAAPKPAPQQARPAAAPVAPVLLSGPGDLVLVLGRQADVVAVAQAMADSAVGQLGSGQRAAVRVAGAAATGRFVAVADRRSALEARAAGVELDRATIVALGWDADAADIVASLGADQIWIAIDAGRKHADSERWVSTVTNVVAADGLAVVGLAETSTPETVRQLGVPVGWTDA